MKQIPLKISTKRIKDHSSITLISEIDRNVSVNVEERFSSDERVLKSVKAQLSNDWRKYFYGELIDSIAQERNSLLRQIDSFKGYKQIEQSFDNIIKSIPEFVDSAEIQKSE